MLHRLRTNFSGIGSTLSIQHPIHIGKSLPQPLSPPRLENSRLQDSIRHTLPSVQHHVDSCLIHHADDHAADFTLSNSPLVSHSVDIFCSFTTVSIIVPMALASTT